MHRRKRRYSFGQTIPILLSTLEGSYLCPATNPWHRLRHRVGLWWDINTKTVCDHELKKTYVRVLANLVQNIGAEATGNALELAHVVDMLDTAGNVVPDAVDGHVALVQVVDPGRVVISTDTILEDDEVGIGNDVGLSGGDNGSQLLRVAERREGNCGGGQEQGHGREFHQHGWGQVFVRWFCRRKVVIV